MALFGIFFFSHAVYALDDKVEKVIKEFLSSQESNQEGAVSQGSSVADLNRDGKPEIVLVWTLLGSTYWLNTLTIFSLTDKGYKSVSSMQLSGEAKLSSVENGLIVIDQTIYAKNDPICCPSIKKKIKYRWQGKNISETRSP
jgi:hypothetical protein